MSGGIFDPERGAERKELYWEKKRFSPDVERRLQLAAKEGTESFLDVINCPMPSCRFPLALKLQDGRVEIVCSNCGWRATIGPNEA